ncbi:hypothetical protein D3C77_563790 [compost metagenome]
MERCLVCGSEDLIHYSDCTSCQRCGAKGGSKGWEYEPDQIQDNIDRYDDYFDE